MGRILDALLGGACLGCASVSVLAQSGRVLGVSGIVRGAITRPRELWRWSFILGMLVASRAAANLHPSVFIAPTPAFTALRAALGGFSVGIGAALGNGCTSGHGICGCARLNVRSFVFISISMAAGVAASLSTSAAQVLPQPYGSTAVPSSLLRLSTCGAAALLVVPPLLRWLSRFIGGDIRPQHAVAGQTALYAAAGAEFALGLAVAGMTSSANVVAFLSPGTSAFDPALIFVMISAIGVAAPAFQTIGGWNGLRRRKLIAQDAPTPRNTGGVNGRLVVGALLFGGGWGATGLCPGPALVNLARPSWQLFTAISAMLLGLAAAP